MVTDANLEKASKARWSRHPPKRRLPLDGMDAWNKNTTARAGLIDRVKASTIDEKEAVCA